MNIIGDTIPISLSMNKLRNYKILELAYKYSLILNIKILGMEPKHPSYIKGTIRRYGRRLST